MRVGYLTMPLHPPGADPGRTMAGEQITAEWENIPCPDLFIAQALGLTRRMKLGTGMSCLPNHNPLMLAPAHRPARPDAGRFFAVTRPPDRPGLGRLRAEPRP
jgi:hypothetical protein